VENVDAFCQRVLDSALDGNGGFLRADQREEALGFLVLMTVELARRYRPGPVSFERYAGFLLRRRLVDWYRMTLGDSRTKQPRPQQVALEDAPEAALVTVASFEEEVLNRVALHR
jgi:hypothetical protein